MKENPARGRDAETHGSALGKRPRSLKQRLWARAFCGCKLILLTIKMAGPYIFVQFEFLGPIAQLEEPPAHNR